MELLIQRLFDGLFNGAIYASLAVALVMIYRSTGLLNLAQGELATFGAYVAFIFAAPASASLAGSGLVTWMPGHPYPMWGAVVLAVVVSMVMGAGIERTVFRGLENQPELAQVNVTIGLLILFSGLTMKFWGNNGRFIPSLFPTGFEDYIGLGGARLRYSTIGAWASLLVIMLLLNLLIRHTKLGLAFRAVTSNREGAELVGIPVGRTLMFGWAVAAGLGTMASTLAAGVVILEPGIMLKLLIYSLAAATLGGLDSPKGAIVGGFVVAQAQTLVPGYLGVPTELAVVPAVVIMLLILLVRPEGLFGTKQVKRV
ncbi:MAG: branched-chain amino acid ABC transporter permease [Acidimicrobiales bacterium]